MKLKTLLFVFSIALLASCSTAYKSGQTPDDLYAANGKAVIEKNEHYQHTDYSYEDQRIRMAAYDYRWRTLDDYSDYNCSYSPYSYGYNYGYYYNPYYYPYPVYSPGVKYINPKSTVIRTTNLNTYNNTVSTYTPGKGNGYTRTVTIRGYNTTNDNTKHTTYETRTYTPSNTNNNSSSTTTTNNSSSNSSSSNSGSSSSGSVSRPARGN